MPLAVCGATHKGRRNTNEDAWLVDLSLGLLLVADGMGGHNAGEVASALAVKTIQEFLVEAGAPPSQALLEDAVQLANERILIAAARQPDHSGMGTTVVAALVTDGQVYYTSVGDSRVYLWHEGRLTQLTRDDSWLAATSGDAEDEPRHNGMHPMRHVLTKVVGLYSDLQPVAAECAFGTGDRLLLCSDGVHGTLPHATLAALLGSGNTVADIAESVVQSAIARGSTDNATAIVARRD